MGPAASVGASRLRGSSARTGELYLATRMLGRRADVAYYCLRRIPGTAMAVKLSMSLPWEPIRRGWLFLSVVNRGQKRNSTVGPLDPARSDEEETESIVGRRCVDLDCFPYVHREEGCPWPCPCIAGEPCWRWHGKEWKFSA